MHVAQRAASEGPLRDPGVRQGQTKGDKRLQESLEKCNNYCNSVVRYTKFGGSGGWSTGSTGVREDTFHATYIRTRLTSKPTSDCVGTVLHICRA